MKKSSLLMPIGFTLLFISCDYWASLSFKAKNNTDKNLSIIFGYRDVNSELIRDSIYLTRFSEANLFKNIGGLIGRNEIPKDIYIDSLRCIQYIFILNNLDTSKINFHARKYWKYKADEKQKGEYTLTIDSI